VLNTRASGNASALAQAIKAQGGERMTVEMDLVSQDSISRAFALIRERVGDPHVVVYNAGYLEGRDLPPDKELLEHIPIEMFETAQHIASVARSWSPRRCYPSRASVARAPSSSPTC